MNATSKSVRMLKGSCLCGEVQYQVADDFAYAVNCYCSQCRRATGSAFKPLAGIEREKLSLVKGEATTFRFGDETNHDLRCARCGSLLYSIVREGQFVHVTLGTLVDEPTLRPTHHIQVGSKAAWYEIKDDLPQAQEFD